MTNIPHNAIRKAAILVSGLDTAAADALLGQMPAEVAARVRNAVLELDTIDPAEQHRILEEFRRASSGNSSTESDGVELDSSLARRFEEARANSSTYQLPPERNQPPFHFLHDTDAAVLARQLQREHAQTIAVVLSHLRPGHAADVLALLLPDQQSAVLERLADLDQADPEVLHEIELQLQSLLADHLRANERRATGRSTIAAILTAAAPHVRRQLASRLGQAESQPKVVPANSEDDEINANSNLASTIERLNRATARSAPAKSAPAKPNAAISKASPAPAITLDFSDVISLNDHSLALVLQTAGPKLTLLALATKSELAARLLRRLPASEQKMLRKRIAAVGPVRVQDMEAAQAEIAKIAGTLAAAQRITLPVPRRLSLAA